MLEADGTPDQDYAVDFICNHIAKLAIVNISKLQIYWQYIDDDDVPIWTQTINLGAQQIQRSDEQQLLVEPRRYLSIYTIPKYVPINRGLTIAFNVCFLFLSIFVVPLATLSAGVWGFFGICAYVIYLYCGIRGIGHLKGPCPYCGTRAFVVESDESFKCNGCEKIVRVRNKKFYQTD